MDVQTLVDVAGDLTSFSDSSEVPQSDVYLKGQSHRSVPDVGGQVDLSRDILGDLLHLTMHNFDSMGLSLIDLSRIMRKNDICVSRKSQHFGIKGA